MHHAALGAICSEAVQAGHKNADSGVWGREEFMWGRTLEVSNLSYSFFSSPDTENTKTTVAQTPTATASGTGGTPDAKLSTNYPTRRSMSARGDRRRRLFESKRPTGPRHHALFDDVISPTKHW